MTKEFCRHCGADLPEGARRCAVCGASTTSPGEAVAPPQETIQRPAEAQAEVTAEASQAPGATPQSQQPARPASAPPPAPAPAPSSPSYPGYGSQYAPYPMAPGVWAPPASSTAPAQPAYQPYQPYQPYSQPYPQYPVYPVNQGQPAGAYGAGYAGYMWPGYAGYAPYYAIPAPRRAPGETYAQVIAWIVTVASGLAIAGGLLVTAISSLGAFTGSGDDLAFLGGVIGFSLAPIVGGGFGLWYGISGIRRKPSPRFSLPTAWFILILAVLAIGGGVALWQFNYATARAPGTAFGVLPLALLTGALPALAILAFASQRLGNPSTRRHVWMSLFYGMTLAPLLAVILELIASLIIVAIFHLNAQDAQNVLGQPTTSNPSPTLIIAELLVLSVVAPVVEEGVKPLAALLAIRRLRTPGEAFLVGLAAGVGFDILETIGYIGQAQADWVSVSIDRIGAGLLHGVGAGMGALAWYYLVNGAGVRLRWLRVIGCALYAVVQHGIFNALSFFQLLLPDSWNAWLNQPFFLGALPIEHIDLIYLVAYAAILGVLIVMTNILPHAQGMPDRTPPAPQPGAWPAWPGGPGWQAWPAAPYGYPAPYAPAAPVAPIGPLIGSMTSVAPIQQLQQPMGGAQ